MQLLSNYCVLHCYLTHSHQVLTEHPERIEAAAKLEVAKEQEVDRDHILYNPSSSPDFNKELHRIQTSNPSPHLSPSLSNNPNEGQG